jgi:hypothetical protein
MEGNGINKASSQVQSATSGLFLPSAGTPTFSGNEMRVPLTGVADVQIATIENLERQWGRRDGGRRFPQSRRERQSHDRQT